jgi:hypothetical protein
MLKLTAIVPKKGGIFHSTGGGGGSGISVMSLPLAYTDSAISYDNVQTDEK